MSATFPNLSEISSWIDARLFITHYRPVEVREYVKIGQQDWVVPCEHADAKTLVQDIQGARKILGSKLPAGDKLGIYGLIEETIFKDGGSLLVFCQSKNQCEQLCSTFMQPVLTLMVKD